MGFFEFFIRKYVLTIMLMFLLMVLGTVSYFRLGIDQMPNTDFPFVTVATTWRGAGPEEIADSISRVIEDSVSSISGVDSLSSTSLEGVSFVMLQFVLEKDGDVATQEVRDKVNLVLNELPKDADNPIVQKIEFGAEPILVYAIQSETMDQLQLRTFTDQIVRRKFERVNGVSSAEVTGGLEREIKIVLNRRKIEQFNIPLDKVRGAFALTNLNVPVGSVQEGGLEYSMKLRSKFASVDDVRNVIITKSPLLTIGDIADVTDSSKTTRNYSRLNGKPAVLITISKQSGTNTVKVSEDVKKAAKVINKDLPTGSRIELVTDNATFIKASVDDINMAIWLGAFLAIITVLLFLGNIRSTFAIALAIPVCLAVAYVLYYFSNFTLNFMSLLALSVSVGLVIDDAIVVLENVYRHREMGKDPFTAAVDGAREILMAVVATSLALVAVFTPIGFMTGLIGRIFTQFGLGVVFMVLASLFEAVTFMPMRMAYVPEVEKISTIDDLREVLTFKHLKKSLKGAIEHAVNYPSVVNFFNILGWVLLLPFTILRVIWVIGVLIFSFLYDFIMTLSDTGVHWVYVRFDYRYRQLEHWYGDFIKSALKRRALTLTIAFLTFVGGLFIAMSLKKGFIPPMDNGQFSVNIELPSGSDLSRTDAVVKQVEEIVKSTPAVWMYYTKIGDTSGGGFFSASESGLNIASIGVKMLPKPGMLGIKRADQEDPLASQENGFPVKAQRVTLGTIDTFLWKQKQNNGPLEFLANLRGLKNGSEDVFTVCDDLRKKVKTISGAKIFVTSGEDNGGKGVNYFIGNTNPEVLMKDAEKVKSFLASLDGPMNLELSAKPGKREAVFDIDEREAMDMGFTPVQLGQELRAYLDGEKIGSLIDGSEAYEIKMYLDEAQNSDINTISKLNVYSPKKEIYIPIESMAKLILSTGPSKIERLNRVRSVTVLGDIDPNSKIGAGDLMALVKKNESQLLSPGSKIDYEGEAKRFQEMGESLGQAFLLAILFTYMVLASQFNSFFLPVNVMMAVPLSFVGAFGLLFLTGMSLNLMSLIGIVMLVGLVTKNAILLIDYTNVLRERDQMPRYEAIIKAGKTRLRPILMTTIALIFGLLPVAMGLGEGGGFRSPMAVSIIGGVSTSMILTLVVVPVTYTLIDDFQNKYFKGREKPFVKKHTDADQT